MIEKTASEVLRDVLSGAPLITFAEKGVQPPAVYYIASDDTLVITGSSAVATTLIARGRVLRPDGIISPFELRVIIPATRTATSGSIQLGEGFLLSIVVISSGGGAKRGQLYVTGAIQRGTGAGLGFNSLLLFSDYIDQTYPVAYPPGRTIASVESTGTIRSVAGTVPAAGADISMTVPTSARWRFRAMRATLTTSAAVATRQVAGVVDDGTTQLINSEAGNTQLASATVNYDVTAFGFTQGVISGEGMAPVPPDIVLAAAFRIRTLTTNLQAGDQWTAPQLLVEEWIEQ